MTALVCVAALLGLAFVVPGTASAATTSVAITPLARTVASNTNATFTLAVTCSTTPTCTNTQVSFPSTALAGDGSTTDFGSWVGNSSCSDVTKTVSGGTVTFNYGTLSSGASTQCTFTVKAPNYTTLNNAKVTITPTISGDNFASSTSADPAVLTLTAAHNGTLGAGPTGSTARVAPGQPLTLTTTFGCGTGTGDLGLSGITITDPLPANFTYVSSSVPSGLHGTLSYDPASNTVTYTDPTGASCGTPPTGLGQIPITINGTATNNGTPDPDGDTICHQSTATVTYLDGTPATITSPRACTTVQAIATNTTKLASTTTLGGATFPGAPAGTPYTFPGDWDQSGSEITYSLRVNNTLNLTQAGIGYDVQDPLPCLDNVSAGVYSSSAPGSPYCAHPAFIPTGKITVTGFTPTAADSMTVHFADGSSTTVPFAAGGWAVPSSPAVAEIDFPVFPEEASNNFIVITFTMNGYAAPTVPVNSLLQNTVTETGFFVGDSSQVDPLHRSTADVIVGDPAANGAALSASFDAVATGATGSCTESVQLADGTTHRTVIQLTSAPSAEIDINLLLPIGASVLPSDFTSRFTEAFTLSRLGGGKTFTTAGAITPTQTPDFNGTGRTLIEWVLPAGLITTPGVYGLIGTFTGLPVQLPAGCAGTQHNDLTVGYGAPLNNCGGVNPPPLNPAGDSDLDSNTIGTNNYCGASYNVAATAINKRFLVDKTVQGNLDATPIGSGGIGNVSPTGGTATYRVTFTNTGGANLTDPVLYDLLPRIGDTDASSTTARGSQYAVTFTGLETVPAGVTVSYSTASNPCRPEVLATNPSCVDDWSTTPPPLLSSVTALKFAYSGILNVAAGTGAHSFTVSYTVSTPAVAGGEIAWNSVGATAFAGDDLMSGAESSKTGLQAASGLTISKKSTTVNYTHAGDAIHYTYTVTNTSSVPLTGVGVTDNLVGADAGDVAPSVTCQSLATPTGTCAGATTTVQPGQSATFTATYSATQADVDDGKISDTATATGTPASGDALSATSSTVTVPATSAPALKLTKSADPSTVTAVGQQVTFDYLVANTGNVTVTGIGIAEGTFTGSGTLSAPSCPSPSLAPTKTETCTATYTVTQADLDAGTISNTATATGTASGAPIASGPSTAAVTATQTAALTLAKTADPTTVSAVGDTVDYSFLVTNTGNVSVTGIGIKEGTFSGTGTLSTITCPASTLAAGDDETCTASYDVTQADLDAGTVKNTATATGKAGAATVSSAASSATVTATQNPALSLTKSADPTTVTAAGQTVTYQFAVTNTGNVTVTGIGIDEQSFTGSGTPSAVSCPNDTLAPTKTENCTATYHVTQADLDAGSVNNTAAATGSAPDKSAVSSAPSIASVTATQSPGLSLVKSADPGGAATYRADQVITYSYVVTNTGNVTVHGVGIAEGTFTGSGSLSVPSCPDATLAPGKQEVCTTTYTLSQADIDAGSIENTATATGTAGGSPVASPPSSVTTPNVPAPAITLTKTVDPLTVDNAGDTVAYSFAVTNSGNVTLHGIGIDEAQFSGTGTLADPICPDATLVPGQFETCSASYTVTQADIDAGTIDNTATATGSDPSDTTVSSESSSATVTAVQQAALTLTKTADPSTVHKAGEVVTYTFLAINAGNVTLHDIAIDESAFTGSGKLGAITCPDATLAPGQPDSCSAKYTMTQADVDAGSISNTARATAADPGGTAVDSDPSTAAVAVAAAPAITLVKSVNASTATRAGQHLTYRFKVTNTGNQTLAAITVTERSFSGSGTLSAISCPAGSLTPGATLTCSATYVITAKDMRAAALVNTAVASAAAGTSARKVTSAASTVRLPVKRTTSGGSSGGNGDEGGAAGGSDNNSSGGVATTGADVLGVGGLAVALLVAGALVLVASRRRRRA